MTKKSYKCKFCGKVYKTERGFTNHSCEKMERMNNKSDPLVQISFLLWKTFRTTHNLKIGTKYKSDQEHFILSSEFPIFHDFVKKMVEEVKPPNLEQYFHYLIQNDIKGKDWTKPSIYDKWLLEYILTEDVDDAFKRSFETLNHWLNEDENNNIDKLSPSLLSLWISLGRISPWLIYSSSKLKNIINNMSSDEKDEIKSFMNYDYWKIKLKVKKSNILNYKDKIKEAQL